MTQPFGYGLWEVYVRNRLTDTVTNEFEQDFTAGFDWLVGPSSGFLNLDRTRVRDLDQQIIPWRDELIFRRDDEEHWGGPITSMSDKDQAELTLVAQDRSVWAAGKRSWKSDVDFSADASAIMERAFLEANVGDPTGIEELVVYPVGSALDRSVRVGQRIGKTLDEYSILTPWSVIGATAYIGLLEADTGLRLDHTTFLEPTNGPAVLDDGDQVATRTHIELPDGTVVSWPEAFTVDPQTQPGLVEAFFELDVTVSEAMAMAKAYTLRSQQGLSVGGSTGFLSGQFPLELGQLRPGLLFSVDTEELGSVISAGDVTMLSSISVAIEDCQELGVSATFGPSFVDGAFDAA